VSALCYRSWAQWFLGYPDAALADTSCALKDAREIGHATTLMYALFHASLAQILCGDYVAANTKAHDLVALAAEKGALLWKALGMTLQGCVLGVSGKTSDAVQMIGSAITALRSTGATLWTPFHLSYLARAHAELNQFDDAWHCIGDAMTAMETTKEKWWEAEVNRVAGEIALMSPTPDAGKAEAYFDWRLRVGSKRSPGNCARR
jgi:predicted ATPase